MSRIALFGAPIIPPYAIYSYDYGGSAPLIDTALVTQTSPDANSSYYFGFAGPVYRAMIHAVALGADCFAALYCVNAGTLVATQLSTPVTITNVPYQIPLVDLGDAVPAPTNAEQMVLRIWSPSGEGCVWTDGYAFCRPDVWLSADHAAPGTIATVEASAAGEVVSVPNQLVMAPYLADGHDDPLFPLPRVFISVPAPTHQEVVKVGLVGGGVNLGSDTDEPYLSNPTHFGPEGSPHGVYYGNEDDVGTPIFYTHPTGSAAAIDDTAPPFFAWMEGENTMSLPQEETQNLPFPNTGVVIGGGNVTNPGDTLGVILQGGAEIRAGERDCVFVPEETVYIVGPGDGVFVPAHDIEVPGPGEGDLEPVYVGEQTVTVCINPAVPASCWDVVIPAHYEYPDAEGITSHTVHVEDMWILPPGETGTSPVVIPDHWDCEDTGDFLYSYGSLASGYFVVSKGVEQIEIECDGSLDLVWTHDHPDAIESYDLRIYIGPTNLITTIPGVTSPYSVDPGYVPPFGAVGGDTYYLAIRANYYDGSWTEDGCDYFPGAASGGGSVSHRFNKS